MKDPYLYPGTDVLKNELNITDVEKLKKAEADYVAYRLTKRVEKPAIQIFDFPGLCQQHHRLFQDVYEWAGKPRVINIEKSEEVLGGLSVEYSDCFDIARNAETVLSDMNSYAWDKASFDVTVKKYSEFMAALWKVHPFREGNTRTIVTFCSQFMESKGHQVNYKLFAENAKYVRNALVASSAVFSDLGDKRKPEFLEKIVADALKGGWNSKRMQKKDSVLEKLENNKKLLSESDTTHQKEKTRINKKEAMEK